VKDTRAVSFVNLQDRVCNKICTSDFKRHSYQPLHNSFYVDVRVNQSVNEELFSGITIVSLESSETHRFKEINLRCDFKTDNLL
jgi:hypothetical protein